MENYRIDRETGAVIFKKEPGKKLTKRLSVVEERIENLEKSVKRLTEDLDEIRDRLSLLISEGEKDE